MVVTALAADLAHALDDVERAAILYDLLRPYADTNVVIGLGAVCLGSTSRYLGRLALTLGRPEQARGPPAPRGGRQRVAAGRGGARALPGGPGVGAGLRGPRRSSCSQQAEAVATERRLPAVARRAALLRERFI